MSSKTSCFLGPTSDMERDWKLQNDNAPPYRYRVVEKDKKRLRIRTIPSPSRSQTSTLLSTLNRRTYRRTLQSWNLAQSVSALRGITNFPESNVEFIFGPLMVILCVCVLSFVFCCVFSNVCACHATCELCSGSISKHCAAEIEDDQELFSTLELFSY